MLLRVGNIVINTATIASVKLNAEDWDKNPCVQVTFAGTASADSGPDYEYFYGHNAKHLTDFFSGNATPNDPAAVVHAIDDVHCPKPVKPKQQPVTHEVSRF